MSLIIKIKIKIITISRRAKDKQFLKNYNKIWEKIESLMSIDFDSKPFYGDDDKYIKTKIRTFKTVLLQIFITKKMPKEKVKCKCVSIIMLDSVLKAYGNYYLQTFLEECKYEKKDKN